MCVAPDHVRFTPNSDINCVFHHVFGPKADIVHQRYNRGMNENILGNLSAWLTQAGLAGTPETEIVSVFCDRCVAAGIPLGRAHLAIDTLHPVHEGSLFRWGYPNESLVHEYGRTSLEGPDVSGAVSLDEQATDVWRRGPFYNMLQTGAALLRRRLNAHTKDEFS